MLISNHLSNFDIWCTFACMPITVRFVAKKELLQLPVFGQALAVSDHIVIDRQDPESAIDKINAAAARAPEGIGILFYAEGTRSRDGKIHEFKKGGVSLALRTGLPIVPMSVSGTRKFLPRGCAVIRPGGRVRLVLGRADPDRWRSVRIPRRPQPTRPRRRGRKLRRGPRITRSSAAPASLPVVRFGWVAPASVPVARGARRVE